jgi:hypothetical protein
MSVYIVVTEHCYGGGSSIIKAFRSELDADKYSDSLSTSLNLDVITLRFRFIPTVNSEFLPIVVSEDSYGGDSTTIRVFETISDAQIYCESLSSGKDFIVCNVPLL